MEQQCFTAEAKQHFCFYLKTIVACMLSFHSFTLLVMNDMR